MSSPHRCPASCPIAYAATAENSLVRGNGPRTLVLADGDVGQSGLGDFDDFDVFGIALRINFDIRRNGRGAYFFDFGVKRNHVAHEYRRTENKALYRNSHDH